MVFKAVVIFKARASRSRSSRSRNSLQQQETNAENKKQEDALKGFQQALQELP